jgi:hypothetical protein
LEIARRLPPATSWSAWLNANDQGPTGPLHAILHNLASGGHGHLPVPWFRAVNPFFLAVIILLLGTCLKIQQQSAWKAWSVLGAPMIWVLTGMALTEIPAMLGLTAAITAAMWLGRNPSAVSRWPALALVSVGMAVSMTGRQTYLVALPAVWWLAQSPGRRCGPSIALALSLIPIGIVFYIWGGLVPPLLGYVGQGLAPRHALMALGIAGTLSLLLAPGFIWQHRRWSLPFGLMAAIINLVGGILPFTSLTSVQKILPLPSLGLLIEAVVALVFAGMIGAFLAALIAETARSRNREFAGCAAGVLLLAGACAGVTHLFSSRYMGMTLPFMIPMLAPWIKSGRWAAARLVVGSLTGAAILYSYYLAHTPGALS